LPIPAERTGNRTLLGLSIARMHDAAGAYREGGNRLPIARRRVTEMEVALAEMRQ
jgi:hypothetical protein